MRHTVPLVLLLAAGCLPEAAAQRIDMLEASDGAQSSDVGDLEARLAAAESAVADLRALDPEDQIARISALENGAIAASERLDATEGALDAHAESLDGLDAGLAASAGRLDDHDASLAKQAGALDDHAASILANAEGVVGNAAAIDANSAAVSDNAADIGSNASSIDANASSIDGNASDIAGNSSSIATNATGVAANKGAAAANKALIAANASDIDGNADAIAVVESDVDLLQDYASVTTIKTTGVESIYRANSRYRRISFRKNNAKSKLIVNYTDTVRTYASGYRCELELIVDGKVCATRWVPATGRYVSSSIEAVCTGVGAGVKSAYVRSSTDSNHYCYMGYAGSSAVLSVREAP